MVSMQAPITVASFWNGSASWWRVALFCSKWISCSVERNPELGQTRQKQISTFLFGCRYAVHTCRPTADFVFCLPFSISCTHRQTLQRAYTEYIIAVHADLHTRKPSSFFFSFFFSSSSGVAGTSVVETRVDLLASGVVGLDFSSSGFVSLFSNGWIVATEAILQHYLSLI